MTQLTNHQTNLTVFNINKKGEDGEYLWSDIKAWEYKRQKNLKQQMVRCVYFDDGVCIDRGLITSISFLP